MDQPHLDAHSSPLLFDTHRQGSSLCLAHKALDHPCCGRTWRVVRTVDRLQRVETPARLGKVEPYQSHRSEVVADDRFGHTTPSAASKQQSVLGTEIG